MIKEIVKAKIVPGTGGCVVAVSYRSEGCSEQRRTAYFQASQSIEATRLQQFIQSHAVVAVDKEIRT